MKLYLSSYSFWEKVEELKAMLPQNARIGVIPNAKDGVAHIEEVHTTILNECKNTLSANAEIIDLQDYFTNHDILEQLIKNLDLLRVIWGNTYVLRDAMKLSWLDNILKKLSTEKYSLIYGGDSAGVCVLAPTLQGMEFIDDPTVNPYRTSRSPIESGLQLINYMIIPHYKSTYKGWEMWRKTEHMEKYLQEHNIAYKTLKDGEVIIIE